MSYWLKIDANYREDTYRNYLAFFLKKDPADVLQIADLGQCGFCFSVAGDTVDCIYVVNNPRHYDTAPEDYMQKYDYETLHGNDQSGYVIYKFNQTKDSVKRPVEINTVEEK